MNDLISAIIKQLERELTTAIEAGQDAHESATHSESIADNKYDTLATEAAYLAHGQSVRIAQLQDSIHCYKHFQKPSFNRQSMIKLGAQVDIKNSANIDQQLFIGPAAGGLSIKNQTYNLQVITLATPLGQALLDKTIDEEFELKINNISQYYTIMSIN
jgi:transcription elongation GreA/GreB family factor